MRSCAPVVRTHFNRSMSHAVLYLKRFKRMVVEVERGALVPPLIATLVDLSSSGGVIGETFFGGWEDVLAGGCGISHWKMELTMIQLWERCACDPTNCREW